MIMIQRFIILFAMTGMLRSAPVPISAEVDWEKFLSRHDMVWNRMSGDWFQAPFLGNGELGTMMRVPDPERINLDVGSSRVHDHRTDDLRITGLNPLISPAVLAYYLPLTEAASELVASARAQSDAILRGDDDRLLAVVGPCSIHDPEAALEYGRKLKAEAERLKDDVFVIMRVYFEKPRTTVGWKGLINDPNLDDSFDINRGLRVARGLLLELANMGIPAGTEFLDTISPQYIADLIAWGAIGARTTESQVRTLDARRIQKRHRGLDPDRDRRHPVVVTPAPLPLGHETGRLRDFLNLRKFILPPYSARRQNRTKL